MHSIRACLKPTRRGICIVQPLLRRFCMFQRQFQRRRQQEATRQPPRINSVAVAWRRSRTQLHMNLRHLQADKLGRDFALSVVSSPMIADVVLPKAGLSPTELVA